MPDGITACLFDLDGVLTQTAKVHAKAWKQMFDQYLRERADRDGEPFREFALPEDYEKYVDGKPRRDGVRSFLKSRNIDLPEGSPNDTPEDETIYGLGLRKNELVLRLIHDEGVEPYDGSVRFVEAARDRGLRRAVVSSSENCKDVLEAAGIEELFEVRIDGIVATRVTSPASRRRTRSWRRPGNSAPNRRRRPCSRTPRPEWRLGAPGTSAG